MNLLLDTHVLLWWLGELPDLSRRNRATIRSADRVVVSAASAWEAGIKRAAGRLEAPDDFEGTVLAEGFEPLTMTFAHAREAAALPLHHGDPFDRMLIAQARLERLRLMTTDTKLARYDVDLLSV